VERKRAWIPSKATSGGLLVRSILVCLISRSGSQGAVAAKISTPAGPVWFVTTHLGIGLHNTQQTEEARQLVVWLQQTLLPSGQLCQLSAICAELLSVM
jgi:hypothetical protein